MHAALTLPIGLQLWTIRHALESQFEQSLAAVAAMGYREVELAGYMGHSALHWRQALNTAGLVASSAHIPFAALAQPRQETLAQAHATGIKHLVIARLEPAKPRDRASWYSLAERLNRAGETCHSAGIALSLHNHLAEFGTLAETRERPCDILLAQTAPAFVSMQLDIAWCLAAGQCPAQFLRQHTGRIASVHLKDLRRLPSFPGAVATDESSPSFHSLIADVGYGVIDWPTLLMNCLDTGVQRFFVEHDAAADPLASAHRSISYLSALGATGRAQARTRCA